MFGVLFILCAVAIVIMWLCAAELYDSYFSCQEGYAHPDCEEKREVKEDVI